MAWLLVVFLFGRALRELAGTAHDPGRHREGRDPTRAPRVTLTPRSQAEAEAQTHDQSVCVAVSEDLVVTHLGADREKPEPDDAFGAG